MGGQIDTRKRARLIIKFVDGEHGVQHVNDSLGFTGAGQFHCDIYVSRKILDLVLNLGDVKAQLSAGKRGAIAPLNIIDVKIEEL